MNIADLLAEAAEETFEKNAESYANDVFEEEGPFHSADAEAGESTASILKSAAQIVVNEDKVFAQEAFAKAVAEVELEVENDVDKSPGIKTVYCKEAYVCQEG